MIKDSGDRTQFESGAVRDMAKGKGRCDLIPLDVAAELTGDRILNSISNYIITEEIPYLYTAIKDFCYANYKSEYDMLLKLAVHFENGAEKYGEHNWQKGIPEWSFLSSGIRHYLKHKDGWDDEDHAIAFVWNIVCLIWTIRWKLAGEVEDRIREWQQS